MPAVEIDPTIVLKAQTPQFDALGTASKAVGLGQGMLNNRLVQQQIQGKEALGRAVTQAQDKITGEIDWTKAQTYLGADPQGSFALPEFGKLVIDRQTAEEQRIKAKADAGLAQLGLSQAEGKYITAGFTPFIQKFSTPAPGQKEPPVPTPEDLQNAINDIIVAAGPAASPNLLKRAATLSQQATTTDPSTFLDRVKGLALMGDPSTQTIAMIYGTPELKDIGGAFQPLRQPGLGGQPQTTGAPIPKTLDPATASSPTPVLVRNLDGTITPSAVTRQQFGELAASGPVMTAAPLSREGLPPATLAQLVTVTGPDGEPRQVTLGSLLGQPVGAPMAPLNNPGGVQTGLAPGAAAGMEGAAATAVKLAEGWTQQAEQAPERIAQIRNLRDQVGRFTTGPKAEWNYRLNAFATQFGLGTKQMATEAAAKEEFSKLAQQFINSNTQQLGDGTDSKLASAMKASPNELMSEMGLTGVLALMEGLEAAKIPKSEAWQKWLAAGNPPTSAQKFQTEWNKIYNPRVFQSVYMDDAQRITMRKRMTPKEREQFDKDWVFAKKAGWLQ